MSSGNEQAGSLPIILSTIIGSFSIIISIIVGDRCSFSIISSSRSPCTARLFLPHIHCTRHSADPLQIADGTRFDILKSNIDFFIIFGLHVGGPDLNVDVLKRHYRCHLIPNIFQSKSRPTYTSGANVPTWAHIDAAVDVLRPSDTAGLNCWQCEWNQRGVQLSVQSWNLNALPGSAAALDPAGNLVGHRKSGPPSCQ